MYCIITVFYLVKIVLSVESILFLIFFFFWMKKRTLLVRKRKWVYKYKPLLKARRESLYAKRHSITINPLLFFHFFVRSKYHRKLLNSSRPKKLKPSGLTWYQRSSFSVGLVFNHQLPSLIFMDYFISFESPHVHREPHMRGTVSLIQIVSYVTVLKANRAKSLSIRA